MSKIPKAKDLIVAERLKLPPMPYSAALTVFHCICGRLLKPEPMIVCDCGRRWLQRSSIETS